MCESRRDSNMKQRDEFCPSSVNTRYQRKRSENGVER